MLKRSFQRVYKLQPLTIRKFQFQQYRQIVDPKIILEQQENERKQNEDIIKKYDKIYKPNRTLEFDRKGALILYSAVPLQKLDFIFKFPHLQIDCITLFSFLNFYQNWFSLSYQWLTMPATFLFMLSFSVRSFQLQNLQFNVSKLSLLKGGKILIVERSTLDGKQYKDWIEISKIKIISDDLKKFEEEEEADFLDKEGQLNRYLHIEVSDYQFKGYSIEKQVLKFLQKGVVHDPELFEAVIKDQYRIK